MKKTFAAIATAATLGLATVAAPTNANAGCYGFGCALAVGLGVATGVAIGTAAANSAYPAYAPAPGYVAYEGYSAPYPVACPGGYWGRRQWTDAYGYVHWSRPRYFCPGP